MNVYKFGGASIADADKIKNVNNIIKECGNDLIVIVSALGKTTNKLEELLRFFLIGDNAGMRETITDLYEAHNKITTELSLEKSITSHLFSSLDDMVFGCSLGNRQSHDYDFWYDAIVSFGELLSSTIVNEYLLTQNINSALVDVRSVLITDNKHRDANVNNDISQLKFNQMLEATAGVDVRVTQGFIAASADGETTTLGREGSDYSAALMAVLSKSSCLTIWKDVNGVLNADPRYYSDATLIPQLNYHDAVELAYSGAQVIHPKTIKPLYNNNIQLRVRSFINRENAGSIINGDHSSIDIPIIVVKHNQILLTITPNNFSFVLEDSFEKIFALANSHRQKVNMVQNSAVSISMVIDNSRYFDEFINTLRQYYKVAYNDKMELVTVRGDFKTDKANTMIGRERIGYKIYLSQHTRRLVRLLRRKI